MGGPSSLLMSRLWPHYTGNALAILLTLLIVLPALGLLGFWATTPLDKAFGALGLWVRDALDWALEPREAEAQFAKIGFAIRAILMSVALSFTYYGLSNWVNQRASGILSKGSVGIRERLVEGIQPWLFVGPAITLLLLFLVVPALVTLQLSFQEADGTPTFDNYAFLWNPTALGYDQFRLAMRNSLMWLLLVPTLCIAFGLLIAVLADSVRWGVAAKTFIFVPLAISFVGAAIIWRNIFAGGGIEAQVAENGLTPSYQIGLLKWLLGQGPDNNEPLYNLQFWGNFFLMWILVWIQTGFAMVIFSAALRGVPEDTIEAATIDGANPFQLFFRIKLPQIYSTVVVVWTTLVILVLKVFDIPFALLANDDDKLLLATMMEKARTKWSTGGDEVDNLFAAIAIMLMLTVIPVMAFNIWRLRREQRGLAL